MNMCFLIAGYGCLSRELTSILHYIISTVLIKQVGCLVDFRTGEVDRAHGQG